MVRSGAEPQMRAWMGDRASWNRSKAMAAAGAVLGSGGQAEMGKDLGVTRDARWWR